MNLKNELSQSISRVPAVLPAGYTYGLKDFIVNICYVRCSVLADLSKEISCG
ncbi:hypothetical protein J9N36_003193 [Salmonella enterica]|nr:hypothetical protein [Salmonella enterica]